MEKLTNLLSEDQQNQFAALFKRLQKANNALMGNDEQEVEQPTNAADLIKKRLGSLPSQPQ